MINTAATNGLNNVFFLFSLSKKLRNEILSNIANHYGVSNATIMEELSDKEAENIMDYVTVSRPAVHLFYKEWKRVNA